MDGSHVSARTPKKAAVHLLGQAHDAAKSRQIQLGATDITPPLNSGLRVCLSMHPRIRW